MLDDPALVDDWHVVAHRRQLAERNPLAVRLLGEDLVIWQAGDMVAAWGDLCIHRGTRLSLGKLVEGDRLECPYHGWTYNTEGRCVHIPAHPDQIPPAKARAKVYRAQERYDLIWVSLGQPKHDIPAVPKWEDDTYRKVYCGNYPIQASGPRIVENFLDVGHFPFVHEGILGDRARPEIADYSVTLGPQGLLAENVQVYQPDGYGLGAGAMTVYSFGVMRPLTTWLAKESPERTLIVHMNVTPHDPANSTAWAWICQNYGYDVPEQEFIDFETLIFNQDIPILESQRPELLPLDLQAELHLRSDKVAIAYRKWLNELGVTFGTA